jgi:biotin carboxyl carrier protein
MRSEISVGDITYQVEITPVANDPPDKPAKRWSCRLNGRESVVDVLQIGPNTLSLLLEGKSVEVRREFSREQQQVFLNGSSYEVAVRDPRSLRSRKRMGSAGDGPQKLVASMPGKVMRILAREGDEISPGQGILVVEAMKMQNEIRSSKAGILKKLLAREGLNVSAGEVLAIVE